MGRFFQKYSALAGGCIWLLWLLIHWPQPLDTEWGRGILLLAALVIVPLLTDVILRTTPVQKPTILAFVRRFQLPSAVALAIAYSLKEGWASLLFALPWAGVLLAVAWVGLSQLWRSRWNDASVFSLLVGMAYLAVAAIWLVLERLGVYPLGFSPDIVFLTIIHFHVAGFVLPVLTGLATWRLGNPIAAQILCYLTIAAVGLLAIGITLTRLGVSSDWEMTSAWLMAIAAAGVAWLHFRLAFLENIPLRIKVLWFCSATSLVGGMLLAGLYGSRFVAPISWLDIPMMRALHGTLNAVGFGLLGVLGHYFMVKKEEVASTESPTTNH